MRRGTVWLLSATFSIVLAAIGWAQQASPLAEEEALRKAVTVQNKMILAPDLLRQIGRQTGVSLTCGRDLANDKLTVFVREMPAVELLSHVATLLVAEWRKTKDGYMLVQQEKARRWEEEFLTAQREQGWKETRQRIRELVEASNQDYTDLLKRVLQMRENLRRHQEGENGGADPKSMALPYPFHGLKDYLTGWLFRRFSRTLWTQLERGEVVLASTFPVPGAIQLPSEAINWAREDEKLRALAVLHDNRESDDDSVLFEQTMPNELLFALGASQADGTLRDVLSVKRPYGIVTESSRGLNPRFYWRPARTGLVDLWSQWQTPEDTDSPLLDTPVRAQKQDEKSPYPNRADMPYIPFTLADLAEQLHKRAEVDIVADAYRAFWRTGMPDVVKREQHTLREWLKAVFRLKDTSGWWRVEGNTLLMKHASYPLYRRTELPEATVRQLERKAQEGHTLTLDDYAKLARTFTPLHELRAFAVRFDIDPLRYQYRHLQLWAALTPVQRANLLRNGILTPDMLSASQQRTFWQCAWGGFLNRGYPVSEPPEEPEDLPIPRLELSFDVGEQYEIFPYWVGFDDTDLSEVIEFARRQFAQGSLPPDYQIKGYHAETYTMRYFLYPGVRYSVKIVLRREIPVPEEQAR